MGRKTIWDVAIEINGKDKGAVAALKTVKKQLADVQAAGKQLGTDFKAFAGNAGKLALGIAGGVTAAGAAVFGLANQFADIGDKVAKISATTGIGIEAYQGLSYAMKQAGLSAEEFDGALEKFNLTVKQGAAGNEAARKQLEEVGLSASKLAGMKPEQAIERLSDYMQTLKSDAERTRVAVTLFGKSAGPKMMAAMKQGSAGLQEMMKEAKGLGIVLTDEQAHQSELFKSSSEKLKSSFSGMRNQFIGSAIGPITEAMETLKDSIVGQMPAIQELGAKFGQWLGDLVTRLPEIIAKIKEFGANIWDNVNKVKDFVGGWENLGIIIGGLAIAPTLISGIKVLESSINLLHTSFKAVKNISGLVFKAIESGALKNVIAIGKQTAALVAQNAVLVAQKIAILAQAAAQGIAKAATVVWTAVQWLLNAAMSANPIGIIILAVAALIAGIVLLVKNFDKVKEVAGKVADAVVGFFKKVGDFFKNLFTGVIDWIKTNWKAIIAFIINPFAGIFKYLYDNFEGFRNFVDNVVGAVKNFFLGLWEGIKNIFSGVGDFFSGVWDGVKNAASNAWGGIKNIAGKAWEGIKGGASKAGEFLKNNWKTIAIGMVNPWAGGLKALYDHNEKFRNLVDTSWGKIKDVAGAVWDKMPDGVKNVFIKIKDTVSGAINNIKEFFSGLWGAIKQGPKATIEYLKNVFNTLKEKVLSVFNNIMAKLPEPIAGAINGIINFFKGGFDLIKNIIGVFTDFFKNVFTDPVNAVKNLIGGLADIFTGVFNSIKEKIQAFIGFFTDKFSVVKDFFGGIGDKIGGLFGGGKNKNAIPGHAEGGIFRNRHIAEIAERGAEAVVPLNNTKQGLDIWKQAGQMGGYFQKEKPEAQTPPIMSATAGKMSGGDVYNFDIKLTNNFSGNAPDSNIANQITVAGQKAADNLEEQITRVLEKIARQRQRVSYA